MLLLRAAQLLLLLLTWQWPLLASWLGIACQVVLLHPVLVVLRATGSTRHDSA
jgi:hypothetical protein